MTAQETLERQRAFTGLLHRPALLRQADPELWSLVRRHRATLDEWCTNRLGYQLFLSESAARLYRLPLDDIVTSPVRYRPESRRVVVLAILVAAAAEDAEDITTTQDLAQRVEVLTSCSDVQLQPYDNSSFAHRLQFVKAIRLLAGIGVLRPDSAGDQDEGWAHRKHAIGGVFEVQRDMLLRIVDPRALRATVQPQEGSADLPAHAARFGIMRRLLELPACYYEDLSEAERDYWTNQRHRLLRWCVEMTGWTVEQRAEGVALVADGEQQTDLPFPQLRASHFMTLMVLDALVTEHGAGADIGKGDIEAIADTVAATYPKALTNELKQPHAICDHAVDLLTALDLLRPQGPGAWRIMPAAARFRDPTVRPVASPLTAGGDA